MSSGCRATSSLPPANCCVRSLLKPHQRVSIASIAAVDPAEISQTGAKGGKETLIFGAVFWPLPSGGHDATRARNLLRARHEGGRDG